jgi:hypothetical protein
MKKIILCAAFVALASTTFCQKRSLGSEDYLKKSKNQKKIAWILLGAGVAFVSAAVIIPEGALTDEIDWTCLCQDIHENDGIKGGFLLAGGGTMVASVPFFLASGKNKKRAKEATAFLLMEKATVIRSAAIGYSPFPAIGIRISL